MGGRERNFESGLGKLVLLFLFSSSTSLYSNAKSCESWKSWGYCNLLHLLQALITGTFRYSQDEYYLQASSSNDRRVQQCVRTFGGIFFLINYSVLLFLGM